MQAILWDNDGVLVDTEGLYFRACQQTLATVGVELTLGQFKEISLRQGVTTMVLATEQGISDEQVEQLKTARDQLYVELIQSTSCVVDGAEQVLRSLHGRVQMGVVTGSRRQHFDVIHAQSGLLKYLDFVLTREDYEQSKPHPESYLTAMSRHGLQPDQCIIVEDSPRGLAAARAAGVPCVIVRSQWTMDGTFDGAVAVVDNIAGVQQEILKWFCRK